jgi:hypothetical protein
MRPQKNEMLFFKSQLLKQLTQLFNKRIMEQTINTVSKMFRDLKQMPYYKNYAAASGKVHNISDHEDAVKDVIIQNGFTAYVPKIAKDKTKRTYLWIEYPEMSGEMPIHIHISTMRNAQIT